MVVPLFAGMLERDRKREGLRVCQVAYLLGVSVREYRELEAGRAWPSVDTWIACASCSGGRRGS